MLLLEARRDLSRTVLTVCLGYVLALHLIIAGLASTSQTVRSLDALLSLDPHAFCLSGAAGESSDEGRSQPLGPHHHDLCCTLAEVCAEVGDGVRDEVAYRGGVRDLHFSTEGVTRHDPG